MSVFASFWFCAIVGHLKMSNNGLNSLICNLYYIIGTLEGHACGLECIANPNLEALKESLANCASVLEQIANGIRLHECESVSEL